MTRKPAIIGISHNRYNRTFRAAVISQTTMFSAITRAARRSPTTTTRAAKLLFSTNPCRQKDPWPLPHTPEHMANTETPPDLPPPPPIERLNESVQTMRARLIYQSRKRGTLESDLLLSTFARENLGGMTEAELREYDKVSRLSIPSH